MYYRLNNIKTPLNTSLNEVIELVKTQYPNTSDIRIIKKSLDARHKDNLHFIWAVEFESDINYKETTDLLKTAPVYALDFSIYRTKNYSINPVIIGSGPAGMMTAYALAQAGLKPVIIERGADVVTRQKQILKFWQKGLLDTKTNVQFGEGGAGTFSDGKLMTGIKKDSYTKTVLETFAKYGAPQEILYLAKPHIGTDNLFNMVQNIRQEIIKLGGEYRFYHTLKDITIQNDTIKSVTVNTADNTTYTLNTDCLILALGHSARDTFEMLYNRGLAITQKPFAVGCRIEHRQKDINLAQYGKKYCTSPYLGAADYKLVAHLKNNRTAYTFCMCPGGEVIGATNLANHVVTNGMSAYKRDKENANSALLINVDERDFKSSHPLAGMYFQEELEKKAFALAGNNYNAPIQLIGDFLSSKPSHTIKSVTPSYRPDVTPSDFRQLFPQEIYLALQQGIREMDKKLKGFASPDGVLTAVETRTSSPIRILRDNLYQSNIKGIYPIGEGAGYAGGITSAATDGIKLAYLLLNHN